MHKFRGDTRQFIGGVFPASVVNAQNINIHITNVTRIVSVHANPHAFPHQYPQRRPNTEFHRKLHTCPPKLFRYCASGGLLDSSMATRMSSGEMCVEAAKAGSYAARQLGSTVRDMSRSACGIAEGVCEAAAGVGGICKGAYYVIAGLLGKELV